jgi:antitoxin VapB
MNTARLYRNEHNQTVSLPSEYAFSGNEVGISRIGEMVVLYPIDRNWEIFNAVEPVTDDFGTAILSARTDNTLSELRESF